MYQDLFDDAEPMFQVQISYELLWHENYLVFYAFLHKPCFQTETSTKAIVPLQQVTLKLDIDIHSYGHFRTETK